jgi:hypothetical protein
MGLPQPIGALMSFLEAGNLQFVLLCMKNSMNPFSCDLWCLNKRRNPTWGAPGAIHPSFEAKLLNRSICGLDYSREPGTSARHDETGPVSRSVS